MQPFWLVVNGTPLPDPKQEDSLGVPGCPRLGLPEEGPWSLLSEGFLNLSTMSEGAAPGIQFHMAHQEVLRITADGRFFVHNREVQNDEEVRNLFADWVRGMLGSQRSE